MAKWINAEEAIQKIKYSSIYNAPCPQWVYGVLKNMSGIETEEKEPEEKHCTKNEVF